MKILAIETSCDETAISVLDITGPLEKPGIKILGNTLLSQVALHEQYGGVYPNLAKREHQKNLPILLEKVLAEVRSKEKEVRIPTDIDFIAVTTGPGLEPALWTGITFAEELSRKWSAGRRKTPIVPVNHMEGHIWSVLYQEPPIPKSEILNPKSILELPALALLVSGGHTELVHIKDFGEYEVIGRTLDDAAGEAFDKVARMLGLPYPGGPKISAMAEISRNKKQEANFKFPRPMLHSKDLNFSFSGLKTAVLYKLRDEPNTPKEIIAKEFEDAVVEVLIEKTRQAITKLKDTKTLIVAGGVSANTRLVEQFKKLIEKFPEVSLHFPKQELSTDNAIMIGIAAFIKISKNSKILKDKIELEAKGNLSL